MEAKSLGPLSATRLGLDFKAPIADQNLNAKIEVDFLGGANLDNWWCFKKYADIK